MNDRIESALAFICPDERDTWVQTGMSIHSELGSSGQDIWMDWSRQADSFKESDARAVWRSFKGSGVSIASLFFEAKQGGWIDKGFQRPTQAQQDDRRRANEDRRSQEGIDRALAARRAADKARWILNQCVPEQHAYLYAKSFQDMKGLVWRPEPEVNLLCIPMFVGKEIAGLQMIDKDGNKKFLSGAITSKAEFCIDSGLFRASEWWVEGYASALSLRVCLDAIKARYRIHVTFSANNLQRMAHSGYVVADHDESGTGTRAAMATGLPYWMPNEAGMDINDFHCKYGTFKTSQVIGKWLRELQSGYPHVGSVQ